MTTSAIRSILIPARARREPPVGAPALVPACLLALGFLPLVALQARALWDRPHCQAFPFAVLGGLVLTRLSTRQLGPLQPGTGPLTLAGLGLCWALLALAALSAWPWLGMFAAMATLLVLAFDLGGWRLLRAVLPAWAFVGFAVLLPSGADLFLISRLQSVVTRWGSPLLDALGVVHVPEGNVIRLDSRRLLVEEACSGINSLFTVVGCTLFFVLYTGRSWARGLFLVAAALVWVVLGNVARVVIVVLAEARWGLDLSHGMPHTLLGLVVLVAVLALTASTDRLLRFAGALGTIHWSEPILLAPKPAKPSGPAVEPLLPTALPDVRYTWLGSRPLGAAFGALGLAQVIWLWPPLVDAFSPNPVVERLKDVGEDDLPAQLGPFQRQRFQPVTRDVGDALGEFSRVWTYTSGPAKVTAAVDYPFRGWHELSVCYENNGWKLKDRVERHGDGEGGAGPIVEAKYDRPTGQALLLFGLDEADGRPLEARPARSLLGYLARRLNLAPASRAQPGGQRGGSRYAGLPPCYQVQLLVEADARQVDALKPQLDDLFNQFREAIRQRIARASKAGGKGGER
jgi:exosortase